MNKIRSCDMIYKLGVGTIYVVDTKEEIEAGDKIMLNDVEVEVIGIEMFMFSKNRKGIIVK